MSADVINLRLARKARGRSAADDAAAQNRAAFGRSKAERAATATETARRERDLDGTKRAD